MPVPEIAPRLCDVCLASDDAQRAFEGAVDALAKMWRAGIVHGDFSTYNLLWWQGATVVIDLPQAVEARVAVLRLSCVRQAASLRERSLARVAHAAPMARRSGDRA